MFLRFWCFALLVCAFSHQICYAENKLNKGDIVSMLTEGLKKNQTDTDSAYTFTFDENKKEATATTAAETPKLGFGSFAGSIVNNTKYIIHLGSNVALGGVKNVGNVIKGGWNFADNVVDGSLELLKKMGIFGFKVVTVIPKGLNDVLLNIVQKGQNRLKEKLALKGTENNKTESIETAEKPDTSDSGKKEFSFHLNNEVIPVTAEEVAAIAKSFNDQAISETYYLMIIGRDVYILKPEHLIKIADALKEEIKDTTSAIGKP